MSSSATAAMTAVLERFAPGFSDIVVAARSIPASRLHQHDANYIGGDIGVGGYYPARTVLKREFGLPVPPLHPEAG